MRQGCATVCHFEYANKNVGTGTFVPNAFITEERHRKVLIARGHTFKLTRVDQNQNNLEDDEDVVAYNMPRPGRGRGGRG